jgi:hypothetical protein
MFTRGSTNFPEIFHGAEEREVQKCWASSMEDFRRRADAGYLKTSEVIVSSNMDGIHFEADDTGNLGKAWLRY